MDSMTIIFAPGQGSQKAGMLEPWVTELSDHARKSIAQWSELTGLDILRLGTTASAEEITDTSIAQPLIVAAGLLAFQHIADRNGIDNSNIVVAGHSVGELTAAAISGVFSFADAITLAAIRGKAMAAACEQTPSTMAAVLGGNETEVLAALEERNLSAANFNAAGQIVAAGATADIQALMENPPAGARVRNLAVAGAFHSPFMESAQQKFIDAASGVQVHDPQYTLLSNTDGHIVRSGSEYVQRLGKQITAPVRWTLCLETIRHWENPGEIIELAPAGTLLAIAKRELKDLPRLAINTPDDVTTLLETRSAVNAS